MVSRALATLDLVGHDDARPAFPAVYLEGDNGHADAYCRLAHALGEEFTVLGIQAAGPYSDAEPRRTVPAMAAAYAGTVRAGAWPARCASCSADQ
jgi:hypothetical protein